MDEIVWRAATRGSDLTEAERSAVRRACRRDAELAAQLDYLLPHLALNLSADFLAHLAVELRRSREEPVMRALAQTIGTPGALLRARLVELAEEECP